MIMMSIIACRSFSTNHSILSNGDILDMEELFVDKVIDSMRGIEYRGVDD
jgi:hypothetical protein